MRRRRAPGLGGILGRGRRRLFLLLIALAAGAYRYFTATAPPPSPRLQPCASQPGCFTGTVTKVVDGDTLDIAGTRVRLVLVDAPEYDAPGGLGATAFLMSRCPEGSPALWQRDSRQPQDPYGRTLAAVWCGPGATDAARMEAEPVNAQIIHAGHARLYSRFCRESEFGTAPWAMQAGCK